MAKFMKKHEYDAMLKRVKNLQTSDRMAFNYIGLCAIGAALTFQQKEGDSIEFMFGLLLSSFGFSKETILKKKNFGQYPWITAAIETNEKYAEKEWNQLMLGSKPFRLYSKSRVLNQNGFLNLPIEEQSKVADKIINQAINGKKPKKRN